MSMPLRAAALVLLAASGLRAAPELPKGQVLEKVVCVSDLSQTYVPCIPTTFDPAKKSPALFCFDPGARGKNPVDRFREATGKSATSAPARTIPATVRGTPA